MLILKREKSTDSGTFGKLTLPDGSTFCTLELPNKENAKNISCIPEGTYEIFPRESTRFPKGGNVWELKNVPNRSDILIHYGNYAGDTEKGLKSDSQGCILIGDSTGYSQQHKQRMIYNSVVSMQNLNHKLGTKLYQLKIEDNKE